MSARPPIIIPGPDQQSDRTWRRFLAGLCLIEFYVQLVDSGAQFARPLIQTHFREALDWYSWICLGRFARAIIFLWLARALWRNHRGVLIWVTTAVLSTLGLVVARFYTTFAWGAGGFYWGHVLYDGSNYPLLVAATEAMPLLRWAMVLLSVLLVTRLCRSRVCRPRGWALLASVWCLGHIFVAPVRHWACYAYGQSIEHFWRNASDPQMWASVAYTIPMIWLAAALLRGQRRARILSLAMAVVDGLPVIMFAPVITLLVDAAIEALLISCPYNPVNPFPWPWILANDSFFREMAVELPNVVAPWLLIAWYARNVPMVSLPDDGSPYPRRYCWKCYYNLEGVVALRCPECGTEIAWDKHPDAAPPVHT